MDASSLDLLRKLLETPSPSGYEPAVQRVVREALRSHADEVTTDVHGNVIASINPTGRPRVMLAGHCDQIGMLVTHIEDSGFVYAQTIGGWDPQQLIGQRMTIWTDSGPIPAVIARKPIHLLSDSERNQVVKLDDLWLDLGARDGNEVRAVVRVGDAVTLELGMQIMRNELINSPGADDKAGLWVVLEAFRRSAGQKIDCALFAVSTVQEEIGLRGAQTSAFGIDPDVGVAVDVTHATDCPTIDKKTRGDIKLGKGPVIYRGPNMNPVVTEGLIATATRHELPFQLAAIGRATPNDANSIQVSRDGVATGLVAIANRYMHSAVEMVSLEDLDHAATLLARFVESLDAESCFVPS